MGNFFLGLFLGSTAAIGFTLGMPLDIRHVTFASGNFGIAVASLEHEVSTYFWVNSIVGIALIGLINVIVSFGLSILIALNSRGTGFAEIKQLFSRLFLQFFRNSGTFFYPVGDSKKNTKQRNGEK
jgi:site-specific recombinase